MSHRTTPAPTSTPVLTAAAGATATAVLANSALYAVARLTGVYPAGTLLTGAAGSDAPSLLAIVGMSMLAGATAAALVAILIRYVPRPRAVFLVLATSVFAGFAAGPLGLDASLGTKLTLELMHLVVAVPIVFGAMRVLAPRSLDRAQRARKPGEAVA